MTIYSRCSRLSRRALLFAVVAVSASAPASALGMSAPPADGALSPALAELAKPSVQAKSPARQAAILGFATEGPGGLLRQGQRVLVEVRFQQGAASSIASLRAAGARIVAVSRRYQTITAAVSPPSLRALAGVAGVLSVGEIRSPLVSAVDCEGGSVISEGVARLHAKAAREAFGVDGSGVTVGVLSDSFNEATIAEAGQVENEPIATHAAEDIETGDLPGPANTCPGQESPVNDIEDQAASGEKGVFDEGRGMLQIVHDVAPGASLAFATAFKGEVSFAHNIEALAAAGAKVIVDDVSYFEEPFFQDGPVAAAVNKVTGEGVTYLSAAGNNNLTDPAGNEIASWEAPAYRDSGTCPAAVKALKGFNGTHCMDFDPGVGTDPTFGIEVEPKATLTVDLQWDEPWFGVETDLDAFLLASGGQLVAQSYEENTGKNGSQKPSEIIQWKNESASPASVNLAINRYSGSASPRLKFALLENGAGVSETEYPRSSGGDVVGPTIYGHAGAASTISVGAERYNNSTAPERFSSRGPVTHYFGPVAGITEAAALTPPETTSKPDLTATDCGATTFFAQLVASVWRFCGTSAAAPNVAGVAALMTEAAEGATPGSATPARIDSALRASAVPIGTAGQCAAGAGLVEAEGAVETLLLPESEVSPLTCAAPLSPPVPEPESNSTPIPVDPIVTPAPTPAPAPAPAPTTAFERHPPRLVRTRGRTARVVFRFASDQSPATFLCAVDGGAFRVCGARLARSFATGSHVVWVKARNAAGLIDTTPAVFGFLVKRVG